ncbi:TPA: hypothetical protein ACH3X2_013379 [Trebouxia sp. C0005]
MDGTFTCAVCCFQKPLDLLWPKGACQCLVCRGCMHLFAAKVWHRRIAALQIVEVSAGRQYAQRDSVWYVFPDGRCEAATIISIDTTMTPTSYGVSFNATPERTRETVAARLKPVIAVDRSDLDCEGYPCPAASCQSTVAASILQELAKEAFDDFCMAANEASLHAMGITGCPNCGTYVERLPPASPLSAKPQAVGNHQGVYQAAALHRATHRYRCAACKQDFCGQCLATPYHADLTCEEHKAPKCLYCQAPLLEEDSCMDTDSASLRELTAGIKARGMDSRWCLEKADLVQLYDRLQQGCSNAHMRTNVTLTSRAVTLNGQDACPICWEALTCGPAIMLICGHACHLACAKEHLKQGYPGPAISFNFLSCPSCGDGGGHRHGNLQISSSAPPMQHPALMESLKRPLELREQTVQRAKQRLKMEGLHLDAALKPGGSFDGRPADFALTKLLFYECHKCSRPYYGGQRQCGIDGQRNEGGHMHAANGSNSQELLWHDVHNMALGK